MPETRLIFYAGKANEVSQRLQNSIQPIISKNKIKISRSIKELSHSLIHTGTNNTLTLLLATGKKDLDDLLAIRDLLVNVRCILILPDDDRQTIAKGLKFYPRFTSTISSDFKDVSAVLVKMLKNN